MSNIFKFLRQRCLDTTVKLARFRRGEFGASPKCEGCESVRDIEASNRIACLDQHAGMNETGGENAACARIKARSPRRFFGDCAIYGSRLCQSASVNFPRRSIAAVTV